MATVKQIYDIVNSVAQMPLGESAVAVVDTASFISLGDAVLSSATNLDLFTNALVDRIGKTVISQRKYNGGEGSLVKDEFTYGCILQKITVDMPDASENESWKIADGGYTPRFAPIVKATVKQKLFNKQSTFEIMLTIRDYQMRTAFTSETQMAVMIDAIFTAMDNKMEVALENNANLCRANFIAAKYADSKSDASTAISAINVLDMYNKETSQTLTVAAALRNADFLKYASRQISLWSKRMGRMSTLFNIDRKERFTPSDALVIDVLQDFASATETYLESDTYHMELVKLPNYNEVPYWVGSGTGYAFADTSSVIVKNEKGETITVSGVIAVVYDEEALGVTLNEQRSVSQRNDLDEYTDYAKKATAGYFNDLSENGIVFYIA